MGMNDTPSGERVHIGFFGRRNAGKSSVVNAVTGQALAVVSDTPGTTTDPVYKAMELLPLGPVRIIDTPGFDDEGELGALRVEKTRQVLDRTDVAVLVAEASGGLSACDRQLLELFREKGIPHLTVWNKWDLAADCPPEKDGGLAVSARTGAGIWELKERIAALAPAEAGEPPLVSDLLRPGELAVLVVPIDKAAPRGRLILPQQQTIRDILDAGAAAVVVKESELKETLGKLAAEPALVITDSQVFARVSAEVPPEVPLTSFSILMARHKGLLDTAVRGVEAVERLRDGDRILVAEGCTHHRQCGDIGTEKLPRWLREHTGKALEFVTCSGREFPEDLSPYALVLHCGGCMLTPREVRSRMGRAEEQGVPITNYGVCIAHMLGILRRSMEVFPRPAERPDR